MYRGISKDNLCLNRQSKQITFLFLQYYFLKEVALSFFLPLLEPVHTSARLFVPYLLASHVKYYPNSQNVPPRWLSARWKLGLVVQYLRTVPTFVSAHMFRVSRKPWFKRARAGVDIDAINYATKYTTKIQAKFSYWQININGPVPKSGTPE